MINRRGIIKLHNQGYRMSTISELMNIKEAEVARTISKYARLKNTNKEGE